MNQLTNFQTESWSIALPANWIELTKSEHGATRFETVDGTKGITVTIFLKPRGDTRSPMESIEFIRSQQMRGLEAMVGFNWKLISEQRKSHPTLSICTWDCFEVAKTYRISGKLLASPLSIIEANFHDYAFTDLAGTQAYFDSIIKSFKARNPSA